MKKIALALAILLTNGIASAYEYEDNPDYCPSIGIEVYEATETGDSRFLNSGVEYSQRNTFESSATTVDLRLPVSNSLTVHAAIVGLSTKGTAYETNALLGERTDRSGVGVKVGLRWYIH